MSFNHRLVKHDIDNSVGIYEFFLCGLTKELLVMSETKKSKRGFAAMDPKKQREIASKGGRTAHEKGTAHEWTSDEAARAGRIGGTVSRGGRGKL